MTGTCALRIRIAGAFLTIELPAEELAHLRAALADVDSPQELLTTEEAARYLRTTRRGVHDRVHRAGLPVLKDGSRCLFRVADLDEWLSRCPAS